MPREPKYDVLFEPVQLGPKTLRNRFWQVPHCNGAGSDRPGMQAAFRGMKAEGGWGAVFTEACHDLRGRGRQPVGRLELWDQGDVRNLQRDARQHPRARIAGRCRALPLRRAWPRTPRPGSPAEAVSQIPITDTTTSMPSGRELGREEIRELRREHVEGFKRARDGGFRPLTLYAGQRAFGRCYFLYPVLQQAHRRVRRLVREPDPVHARACSRMRQSRDRRLRDRDPVRIDTLDGAVWATAISASARKREGKAFIAALDDLVDYWDINIGTLNWGEDAGSSRFFDDQPPGRVHACGQGGLRRSPCINVGRFTDPDVMVQAITLRPVRHHRRPPGPRSPTRSCPRRSRRAGSTTSASASAATSASHVGRCGGRADLVHPERRPAARSIRRGWHPEKFTQAANAENAPY